MKRNLFLLLAASFITIALTGCYTMVDISHNNVSEECAENPIFIYYPIPVPEPVPSYPRPVKHTITHPVNPVHKRTPNRTATILRNNNGGRRDESARHSSRNPSRVKSEVTNPSRNGYKNNSKQKSRNANNNTGRNNNSGRSNNRSR